MLQRQNEDRGANTRGRCEWMAKGWQKEKSSNLFFCHPFAIRLLSFCDSTLLISFKHLLWVFDSWPGINNLFRFEFVCNIVSNPDYAPLKMSLPAFQMFSTERQEIKSKFHKFGFWCVLQLAENKLIFHSGD